MKSNCEPCIVVDTGVPVCETGRYKTVSVDVHGRKRMRARLALSVIMALAVATGCQTVDRGVLTIPTTRDYGNLPEATIEEAAKAVDAARLSGAPHAAPYEYFSAEQYLALARQQKDRKSRQDYALLAKDMADAATRSGPTLNAPAEAYSFEDEPSVRAAYDSLLNRYDALDKDKARAVGPVLLARITAGLSEAEHAFSAKKGWKEAAPILRRVTAYLDTLTWQDTDGDRIADMVDAAPLAAEDMDGFEDEDGAPDPDNDNDGVPDIVDVRPMDPETRNQWHDEDGAPDDYPVLDSVYFAAGSTALSSDAKGYLKGLKHLLDEWPGLKLHIKGYADTVHSEVYGMEMSQRRAEEVRRHLLLIGVAPERLETTFHGAAPPSTTGESTSASVINDRVELSLDHQ